MQSYQSKSQPIDFFELILEAAKERNGEKLLRSLELVSIDLYSPLYGTSPISYLASQNDTDSVDFLLSFGASYARASEGFARAGSVKLAYTYLEKSRAEGPEEYQNALLRVLIGFIEFGQLEDAEKIFLRLREEYPDQIIGVLAEIGRALGRFRPDEEIDIFLRIINKRYFGYGDIIWEYMMDGLGRANRREKANSLLSDSKENYSVEPSSLYLYFIGGFYKGGHTAEEGASLKEQKDNVNLNKINKNKLIVYGEVYSGKEGMIEYILEMPDKKQQLLYFNSAIEALAAKGEFKKIHHYLMKAEELNIQDIKNLYKYAGYCLVQAGHILACKKWVNHVVDEKFRLNLLEGMQEVFLVRKQISSANAFLSWIKEQNEKYFIYLLHKQAELLVNYNLEQKIPAWLDEVRKHYPNQVIPIFIQIGIALAKKQAGFDKNTLIKALVLDIKVTPPKTDELKQDLRGKREEFLQLLNRVSLEDAEDVILTVEKYDELMQKQYLTFEQARAWVQPDLETYLVKCKQVLMDERRKFGKEIFGLVGSFLAPLKTEDFLALSLKLKQHLFHVKTEVQKKKLTARESLTLKRRHDEESYSPTSERSQKKMTC